MFAILEKEYFFNGEIAAGFNVTLKTGKVNRLFGVNRLEY